MNALPIAAPQLSLPVPDQDDLAAYARQQEASEQLEAVFISMLVKEMRTAGVEEGLFAGDASDTFGGLFDQFMADELASSGGIGLQQFLQQAQTLSPPDLTQIHRQAQEAYAHGTASIDITTAAQ